MAPTHSEKPAPTPLRKTSFSSGGISEYPVRNGKILRNFDLLLPKFHFILPNFYFILPKKWAISSELFEDFFGGIHQSWLVRSYLHEVV